MSTPSPYALDAEVMTACHQVVTHLVVRNPQIAAALISTSDGFEVSSEALEPESMARLAAMTSSMVALGDAVVREMKLRSAANLVIEADLGCILMQSVPHSRGTLLVTLVANPGASVKELNIAADQAAAELMIALA